ncbi:hypothetical protein D088_180002 [Salmonella enterica subsp. houtenae serovar 16:z4,z32:-- str. RKS3027]|nr:hypothetical protein D088_180002 [Salmonella enterica subsp. houtenae serovar 16:z4,z32:-- str. RKS3027]
MTVFKFHLRECNNDSLLNIVLLSFFTQIRSNLKTMMMS